MNVKLISTSINYYENIDDLEQLYDMEKQLYEVGLKYLSEHKYYPGSFYALGQKM